MGLKVQFCFSLHYIALSNVPKYRYSYNKNLSSKAHDCLQGGDNRCSQDSLWL